MVSDLTYNTFRDHLVLEYEIMKIDGDLGNPNVYVPRRHDDGRPQGPAARRMLRQPAGQALVQRGRLPRPDAPPGDRGRFAQRLRRSVLRPQASGLTEPDRAAHSRPSSMSGGIPTMTAIKRNLAWLLFSQAATWGVSIALLLIVPDSLGDMVLRTAVVRHGLHELLRAHRTVRTTVFLSKTIARDTASAGRYLFNTLALKSILATLVAGTAIALAVLLDYPRLTLMLICIGCLSMIFTVAEQRRRRLHQGLQRMRRPALWEIVRSYVAAGAGLTVLLNGGTLVQYTLVFSLASAIPLVANLLGLRSELAGNRLVSVPLWSQILVGGFRSWSGPCSSPFTGPSTSPSSKPSPGTRPSAGTRVAYSLGEHAGVHRRRGGHHVLPALSAQGKAIGPDFARTANRALKLVILVAAPAATGITLIARDFVTTLYGARVPASRAADAPARATRTHRCARHDPRVDDRRHRSATAMGHGRDRRGGLQSAVEPDRDTADGAHLRQRSDRRRVRDGPDRTDPHGRCHSAAAQGGARPRHDARASCASRWPALRWCRSWSSSARPAWPCR